MKDDMPTKLNDAIDTAAAAKTADTDTATVTAIALTAVPATAMTAPPGKKFVDPFAHYAAGEGGTFFSGDYVRLDQTLGWVRGQEKEPLDATEAWIADVNDARHGWIRFGKSDGESTKRHTVLIREHPELPACPACGGTNADEHEKSKRCDWRPVVYLPLRSVADPDDVVCFTGTGKGARVAMAQLCGVYARPGADRRGKSPRLLLKSRSFENDNKGTTVWPVFDLDGWEFFTPGMSAPEVQPIAVPIAPPAKPAAAALPKHGDVDLNDEIPF
jgi:hypothetical protein